VLQGVAGCCSNISYRPGGVRHRPSPCHLTCRPRADWQVYHVLQRVAACCSVLQRVAACCSVLQPVKNALQCAEGSSCRVALVRSSGIVKRCSVLQRVESVLRVCCSVLQFVAVC